MNDPIFALHGWGLNAAVFDPLATQFADRQMIAPDLPGHGQRAGERMGRDANALVERLLAQAPQRAVWLGWSLGGMLALAAARAAPERVPAVIIVAATASFVARPGWPQGLPPNRIEAMATQLAQDTDKTVNEFLNLQVRTSAAAGKTALHDLRQALQARGMAAADGLADGLALLRSMDYSAALAHIRQPTLVVAGGRDRLVHPAAARALAKGLPAGQFELMPQAAHAPFLSHRQVFCDRVETFLTPQCMTGQG